MQPKLTPDAAKQIINFKQETNNPNLNLRIYITGGGCSGFKYSVVLDDQINDDDTIITDEYDDEAKLIIDSMSFPYLTGATVDFRTGLQEEFVIHNPNSKTTCGCGSSFSLEDDE